MSTKKPTGPKKTAIDYQREIKWREVSEDVGQAARLALWLIVDQDETFKHAIDVATNKTGAKAAPTKKLVKAILPADFLRKAAAARMKPEVKAVIKAKKIEQHAAKRFQKNEEPVISRKSPRTHKSITLKFNEYEYEQFKILTENYDGGSLEYLRELLKKESGGKKVEKVEVVEPVAKEEKPKRLTIDIPPSLHREFKAFCATQGKTMSVVFVDAITKVIEG